MILKYTVRVITAIILSGMLNLPVHARENIPDISDSIAQLLGQTRDTSRVDLLLKICEELRSTNPQQAFGYANQALSIARELNDPRRTGRADRAVAGLYIITAVYDKAMAYLLEAQSIFEELHDTLNLARCYNDIGMIYRLSGEKRLVVEISRFKSMSVRVEPSVVENSSIRGDPL